MDVPEYFWFLTVSRLCSSDSAHIASSCAVGGTLSHTSLICELPSLESSRTKHSLGGVPRSVWIVNREPVHMRLATSHYPQVPMSAGQQQRCCEALRFWRLWYEPWHVRLGTDQTSAIVASLLGPLSWPLLQNITSEWTVTIIEQIVCCKFLRVSNMPIVVEHTLLANVSRWERFLV